MPPTNRIDGVPWSEQRGVARCFTLIPPWRPPPPETGDRKSPIRRSDRRQGGASALTRNFGGWLGIQGTTPLWAEAETEPTPVRLSSASATALLMR